MFSNRKIHYAVLIPVGVTVFVVASLLAWNFEVYEDCGYICKNTASRRGYRAWCIGLTTGDWYKMSALEEFMQEHYPNELEHKWTSYEGTGRNILGISMSYGHGRPGPIILLRHDLLAKYMEKMDNDQKKALYDLFASDDKSAIETKVDEMFGTDSQTIGN